jgi:hypothetical protein
MFIVLEGTDASGKSTLAAEIKRQLLLKYGDVTLFHKGKPEEETRRWALNEYGISISTIDWTARHAIADRWHWGEITYAPLKRPQTCVEPYGGLLGVAGWRWIELFMASRGIAQFWVYQPLEVILERLEARGDDFVTAEELSVVLDGYTDAHSLVLHLDGTVCPPKNSLEDNEDLAKALIQKAAKKAKLAEPLAAFPEYIGSPTADVLLVGDKRDDKTATILPFMPVDSNSGDYLLKNLPEDFWRSVGLINVDDINGERLSDLWNVLGEPRIVALGRTAEQGLKDAGFSSPTYNVVAHPQYVSQFHHHDGSAYGNAIKRLGDLNYVTTKVDDPWILR